MDQRIRRALSRHLVAPGAVLALASVLLMSEPGPWAALLGAVVAFAVGIGPSGVRRGAVALLLAVLLSTVLVAAGGPEWRESVREMVFALARTGIPWLAGVAWRLRRQVGRQATEALAQKRRERSALLREERDGERLALAESLHDDLGHALSLVALNLGRLELDPALPPTAHETVTTARRQLSQAVERLGASVASLRDGAAPGVPHCDDVDALLERAGRAGVEVEVTGMPSPGQLSAFDRESLTRVLREAVTNAVKHAPGQAVRIGFTCGEALEVTVRNPVTGHRAGTLSGTGLSTLAHRLRAEGGELETRAGDREFSLRARIPPKGPASPPAAAVREAPADDGGHEDAVLTGARRRGRAILAGTAVLAVAVLGAVEAFDAFETRRALLSSEDFALIRVGDTRTRAARLLPSHEVLPRPASDPGTDCHDYAVTADPFDDASGDAYRICYTAGLVVSARYVSPENP
ncbi:sensor histidine kinase [Streptomyces nitrosporeus]|uniref:sensor histidine kinase n=1 Tax=Streptomyces nitrosporeus TaxID=28894 RepID=UPI003320F37B